MHAIFYVDITDGSFSPDIAKYSSMIVRMKQQEYRNKQRRYYHNLLKEILLSRQVLQLWFIYILLLHKVNQLCQKQICSS